MYSEISSFAGYLYMYTFLSLHIQCLRHCLTEALYWFGIVALEWCIKNSSRMSLQHTHISSDYFLKCQNG